MSFVEGIATASPDVADPTFVLCLGAIALLVTLLLAAPGLATALHFLRIEHALSKLYGYIVAACRRIAQR